MLATPQAEPRTAFCRNRKCGRSVAVPEPAEGHPYGWLALTVNVPSWFNAASGRSYRWIGMFCSVQCLAEALPEIEADELLHRQAYEAE